MIPLIFHDMDAFLIFFMSLHYTMTTIGLLLNGFLIYLIAYQTPTYIRTYALLILNFALTDFSVCLADMFTQQRVIPCGFRLAYFSAGPCGLFGSYTCYVGYSVMLHLYAHSLWSLLLTFFYRYYILKYDPPARRTVLLCLCIIYLPSLFQMITFNMSSATEDQVKEILAVYNYPHEGQTTSGNWYVLDWKTAFTMFHMTLPVTPVYAAILWLRKQTIRMLNEHSGMSNDTKTMHSLLLRALTFQACLPCLYWIGVISYGLGQTGIYNHPALEYVTFMSFVFLPVLSPLSSLYFVKPYRDWILRKSPTIRRTHNTEVVYISNFDS